MIKMKVPAHKYALDDEVVILGQKHRVVSLDWCSETPQCETVIFQRIASPVPEQEIQSQYVYKGQLEALKAIAHKDMELVDSEDLDEVTEAREEYLFHCRSDLVVELFAERDALLAALEALFKDYKRGADSGDWGNWSVEDTDVGRQALEAMKLARGDS